MILGEVERLYRQESRSSAFVRNAAACRHRAGATEGPRISAQKYHQPLTKTYRPITLGLRLQWDEE